VDTTHHDFSAEYPEDVVEEQANEQDCTYFITTDGDSFYGLDTKRYTQDVVQHVVLGHKVIVGEYTGEQEAHDFRRC
jgi:hypothetical protein